MSQLPVRKPGASVATPSLTTESKNNNNNRRRTARQSMHTSAAPRQGAITATLTEEQKLR
jgi:hypothetical protein